MKQSTHYNGFKMRMGLKQPIMCVALAAFLSLAACSTYQPSFPPLNETNKITVAETIQRLELYAPPSGLKLSARDNDAVASFLSGYAQSGQGPLYVNVPASSANGLGVSQTKSMLSGKLAALGLSPTALQAGQYPSRPGAPAPVVVSYRRLATAPIDCSMGSNLIRTSNNQPYPNFGCVQSANLAAMIDNPRQLLAPYEVTPLPANKRTLMIDNYVKGEPTATAIPERQRVTVDD